MARQLARTANRRSMLRGMTAGILGIVGLRQTDAGTRGRGEMVTICHATTRGAYRQISVRPEAVRTHEKHPLDIINPDFSSNENCGGCGITCTDSDTCGGGGNSGVCGQMPGTDECPPYMIPNPVSGGNPCWYPCDLNGCSNCSSGFCVANSDGSAFCLENTDPNNGRAFTCLPTEAPGICQGPPIQLWDNLRSEPNSPMCGTWRDASSCSVTSNYALVACPSA